MNKLRKNKQCHFLSLFQQVSPRDFVLIFGSEHVQTLAFMLSYAPGSYARKVFKLIKDENHRKSLAKYVAVTKCSHKASNPEFIKEIEKTTFEYIKGFHQ
jgi:flagellar motor switch protein FliG